MRNRRATSASPPPSPRAAAICDEDVETNRAIGEHGLGSSARIAARKKAGERVNILTHCNAGWLATVDWGTALAPIYHGARRRHRRPCLGRRDAAAQPGRPLTAWELGAHGVPHTRDRRQCRRPSDAAGQVDLCIVGTDRTTANGDVANKIGTYLKALAAQRQRRAVLRRAALSTIDWTLDRRRRDIPIEERSADEVTHMTGRAAGRQRGDVEMRAPGSPAANYGFDVTPARLVTGFITERGVAPATPNALATLYPEHGKADAA